MARKTSAQRLKEIFDVVSTHKKGVLFPKFEPLFAAEVIKLHDDLISVSRTNKVKANAGLKSVLLESVDVLGACVKDIETYRQLPLYRDELVCIAPFDGDINNSHGHLGPCDNMIQQVTNPARASLEEAVGTKSSRVAAKLYKTLKKQI